MPPKKKEKGGKGGKGGKGAGPVPNAFDEPPQPAPGSPYCLSLSLEVSLLVDPSACTAETGHEPESGGVDGVDANRGEQRTQPLLVEPVFRYTFVNGERITTPPVGLPGSSWTKLSPGTSGDGAPEAEAPTTPVAPEAPAGTMDVDGEPGSDRGPPEPVLWRYTRMHQLLGADEDEVALTLDRKSIMQVTLADKSQREATVQPAGVSGGGAGEGKENDPPANVAGGDETSTTALAGRNFIESWPLDLSAFLAGETSVSVHAGGGRGSGHRRETDYLEPSPKGSIRRGSSPSSIAPAGRRPEGLSNTSGSSSSRRPDAPPAPEGIHFIKVSVTLPSTGSTAAADADQDPNLAVESETATKAASVDGTTTTTTASVAGDGIDCRRKKLLSAEAMVRLNPLSITISSAASLPGVRIEAESLQYHVKPTHFRLLDLHCKPVYVVCRPFPNDPLAGSLHPRILWTAGLAQRESVQFEHTSAYLLGPMDRHRVEDWVENSMLSVEIHDRDPRPSAKEQRERVLRLERMVAGGYPEDDSAFCSPSRSKATGNSEATDEEEKPPIRYAAPRDIYEVDEVALQEAVAEAESAGKHNAHGVASFRLSGLLDQSRQLVMAYSSSRRKLKGRNESSPPATPAAIADVAPRVKMRSDICQRKRREIPKGGVEDWHLSDEERLVRWPGAYLDAGSSLGLRMSLARPLRTLEEGSAERTGPATEEPRPFSRAVLVVGYEEGGALVRAITAAMDHINGRALANIQGSLRAYVLTPEEKQAADNGTLDIVCGFMVIDEDSRTIVLEGASGPKGGLTALLKKVGRAGPNGRAYRALENPEVRFSRRLYTSFDADLKKVRLRDPLPTLCMNPEIYDRSKVSSGCFDALHCLRMLRKVDRLREAAEQGLFPEAAQLVQVESKYGESVSVKDITGKNPVAKKRRKPAAGDGQPKDAADVVAADVSATPVQEVLDRSDGKSSGAGNEQAPARRKAPTDSTNVAFEEWLRGRRPRDFLAEQDNIRAMNHEQFLEMQRRKEEERRAETVRTDWCYGPQKLNYVELKKAEMRERLAKDKGATYTYSMDYVSQTVSLVDEFRVKEDQEAASRAAWKTKRGFVWPCPRTRQELITHPSKPSQSRIDTLREPWVENELTGGGQGVTAAGGGASDAGGGPPELAWRREFDTVPSNGKAVFGGLQPSKYSRPLDTDLIGSRHRLPRGRQQLDKDPEFFRSVHLVGEGLAREKEEAKRRAHELWQSKVVVDDPDFRVGNFSVRDTPLQADRAKDILQPPVNKTAFRIVRNARLPSGKRAPLRPAPVSAFSLEPFAEPEDFTVSIRGNHREKWAATDPATGEKADFYLRLHGDRMKRKSHKAVARTKHPPLTPSEMKGPRWDTNRGEGAVVAGRDGERG